MKKITRFWLSTFSINRLSILFSVILLSSLGCGGDAKVHGKITFPDGKPLGKGVIYFENETLTAKSNIDKDGGYNIGKIKPGDGIPRGRYKISITATETEDPTSDAKSRGKVKMVIITHRPLVDPKYASVRTSGLEVEVDGSMKHDIVVDPPSS